MLRENGLTLNLDNPAIVEEKVAEITDFSPESKYVLEQALNAARLKQKKYIETEHLLLGLIQLLQLGNSDLEDIFQQYEVDTRSLLQKITEAV